MSKETNRRRCRSCKKLLLDEKLPFCRRCMLEGRDKARQIASIGAAATAFVIALVNNSNHDSDDKSDEEKR